MRELDAVNIALRSSGGGSVNSLAPDDPKAAHALSTVRRVRKQIMLGGYDINTDIKNLSPASDGRIVLNDDWLMAYLPRGLSYRVDSADGAKKVWDVEEDDWYGEDLTDVRVVFDITDFSKIPETLANWIAWQAAGEYFHEHQQASIPHWLLMKLTHAQSTALNSMNLAPLADATGWTTLQSAPYGNPVRVDEDWVYL